MSESRHFDLTALGLAVLHLVLGLLVFEPTLFSGGDNAGYLILGDALRSGEGYRDLYLPDAPLHARYPPLLPVLLAGLGWVGGVGLAKVAMLLCTTAAVWATARFGRRWVGTGPALGATAVLAVNPTLLDHGHYILSEAPFTLLVVAALGLSLRKDRRGTALAMMAAVAAFATRTAGMTVLAALPLAWLLEGRRSHAAWSGLAATGVLGVWALYQRWAAASQAYLGELLLINPYAPEPGTVSVPGLFTRAAENSWAYVSRVVPETLLGPGGGGGAVGIALGLVVASAALAGWAIVSRKGLRAPAVFAVLYAGLIAVWPSVWTDRRFLLPLIPVILLLALACVWAFPLNARLRLKWAAPAVIVILNMVWTVRTAPARLSCVSSYMEGTPCDWPEYTSFYAAALWARENTSPDAIIANRKPRLFFWHARRRGDLYPLSTEPEVVIQGLEDMGADYVVVDWISFTTDRYLIPAMLAHEPRFEPAYTGGTPPTMIFRFLSPSANVD